VTEKAKINKGEATQAAILNAARDLFALRGFDRTTVRDVASRAGIDPAMVIRYFGSKDELFALAVVFDLKLPDLSDVPRERFGETLARHYLGLWEGETRNHGLPLLIRSAASNEFAAAKMREMFTKQVMPVVMRAAGKKKGAERAGLVASQLLGMALCRYIIKLPPIVGMSQDQVAKYIGPTLQRYISDPD